MADETYLSIIEDAMRAVGASISARLAAQGLDELVDWYNGELPKANWRETNCPYAWWDWESYGEIQAESDELEVENFEADLGVVLGLAGYDPDELVSKVSLYPPQVVAAVENTATPYNVRSLGIFPGPRGNEVESFRTVLMPFRFWGVRAWAGVS